jgi:predicted enzyme related to lactoylglutathione lyase
VINAVHTLIYAEDAQAARAFMRDVVGWPSLDVGDGWLIFRTGPSELGVHPRSWEGEEGAESVPIHHQITLMCDDIEQTIDELSAKGATFSRGVLDEGWGRTTMLVVPGAGEVMVYQPRHPAVHTASTQQ